MEDEDDVVIEEIPVFLSKNLENKLFLFQYPNKTNISDLDNARVVNCCAKPINHEVKVDFHIDTESEFYDEFKGKQFAIASDGKVKDNKMNKASFKSGIMDKQSFIGIKPIENAHNYCIGIYQDNEIHLSPLANIFQMQPTFSYFDKEDRRNKAEQKAANEDNEDELQQITVKFSRNDADRLRNKQRNDYTFDKSNDESWCETLWHSRLSPTSELERSKLFVNSRDLLHSFDLSEKKYIEKLIPQERSDQSLEVILPSKIVSKTKLRTMNLMDQLKNILRDGKIMNFSDIMRILEECNKNITTEKVLRTLPVVGQVIRGNWVPQSEILYPSESLSNANGVPSDLMIRGRNYVLYKFSKQDYLHRRKVITSTQLPTEEATEILQSVARLNSEKKWELLCPPDTNFESHYTDIVQRQEMLWRATEQTFLEMDYEKSPKRIRKKSVRETKTEKL